MHFFVYKDRSGDWRWRYKSPNGNTIADSAEGYRNKSDCFHGIQLVKGSSVAPVYE